MIDQMVIAINVATLILSTLLLKDTVEHKGVPYSIYFMLADYGLIAVSTFLIIHTIGA